MRLFKLIVSLAAVLLGIGSVSALQAERARGPRVRFEGRHRIAGGPIALCFSVETTGRTPRWIRGYLPSPGPLGPSANLAATYDLRVRMGGQWVPDRPDWCKSGTGMLKLEPGARSYFSVLAPEGRWQELQVGLSWSPRGGARSGLRTTWSEPVTYAAAFK